jgi:hypothetical protein
VTIRSSEIEGYICQPLDFGGDGNQTAGGLIFMRANFKMPREKKHQALTWLSVGVHSIVRRRSISLPGYLVASCGGACCLPACLSACLPHFLPPCFLPHFLLPCCCLSASASACLPACLPASPLPACLPAFLPACLPACLRRLPLFHTRRMYVLHSL